MPRITYEPESHSLSIEQDTAAHARPKLHFSCLHPRETHGQWQDFIQQLRSIFPEVEALSRERQLEIQIVRLDRSLVDTVKDLGRSLDHLSSDMQPDDSTGPLQNEIEPLPYDEHWIADAGCVAELTPLPYQEMPVTLHYAGPLPPPAPFEEEDMD